MMTDYRGARGHPRGGVKRGPDRPAADTQAVTSPSDELLAPTTLQRLPAAAYDIQPTRTGPLFLTVLVPVT